MPITPTPDYSENPGPKLGVFIPPSATPQTPPATPAAPPVNTAPPPAPLPPLPPPSPPPVADSPATSPAPATDGANRRERRQPPVRSRLLQPHQAFLYRLRPQSVLRVPTTSRPVIFGCSIPGPCGTRRTPTTRHWRVDSFTCWPRCQLRKRARKSLLRDVINTVTNMGIGGERTSRTSLISMQAKASTRKLQQRC